jgi:D-alanine transaminase
MGPHLERAANGLAALEIEGVVAADLEEVCETLLEKNGLAGSDATVYLQVTRGAAPRAHWFPDPPVQPTVYGTAAPFKAKGDPAVGVDVITQPDHRWTRCDIKSVALLPNCLAVQRARKAGAAEAVLVRDGVALEGTHTSFFGVVDGVVRTAPRSNYVLPSITRAAVLEICLEHGIAMDETPILLHEMERADELFLAGTTMEVMPIVRVDGRPVAAGKPGPIARRLLELFREQTR